MTSVVLLGEISDDVLAHLSAFLDFPDLVTFFLLSRRFHNLLFHPFSANHLRIATNRANAPVGRYECVGDSGNELNIFRSGLTYIVSAHLSAGAGDCRSGDGISVVFDFRGRAGVNSLFSDPTSLNFTIPHVKFFEEEERGREVYSRKEEVLDYHNVKLQLKRPTDPTDGTDDVTDVDASSSVDVVDWTEAGVELACAVFRVHEEEEIVYEGYFNVRGICAKGFKKRYSWKTELEPANADRVVLGMVDSFWDEYRRLAALAVRTPSCPVVSGSPVGGELFDMKSRSCIWGWISEKHQEEGEEVSEGPLLAIDPISFQVIGSSVDQKLQLQSELGPTVCELTLANEKVVFCVSQSRLHAISAVSGTTLVSFEAPLCSQRQVLVPGPRDENGSFCLLSCSGSNYPTSHEGSGGIGIMRMDQDLQHLENVGVLQTGEAWPTNRREFAPLCDCVFVNDVVLGCRKSAGVFSWDLETLESGRLFEHDHAHAINLLRENEDRTLFASVSEISLRVWDLRMGESVTVLYAPGGSFRGGGGYIHPVSSPVSSYIVVPILPGKYSAYDLRKGFTDGPVVETVFPFVQHGVGFHRVQNEPEESSIENWQFVSLDVASGRNWVLTSFGWDKVHTVRTVIDLGSSLLKVGFGDQDAPTAVFSSMVKRPKNPGIMVGMDAKDCFVGDEAWAPRGVLKEKWPIRQGKIENWNDTEKLLHHSFYNELRVTPEEHGVFLAEEADTPSQNREKLCSILRETFNALKLCIASRSSLSMIFMANESKSKSPSAENDLSIWQEATGLVLQCGATCCRATPVLRGQSLSYAHQLSDFGGEGLTLYLVELLKESGIDLTSRWERVIVRDIKEKLGYIVEDFDEFALRCEAEGHPKGFGLPYRYEYELPDGSKIEVESERYRVAEALFDPSLLPPIPTKDDALLDHHSPQSPSPLGLAQIVHQAIQATPEDLHQEFYRKIVLAGGSSLFVGLEEVLKKRVEDIAPPGTEVCVVSSPKRKLSAWLGGAVLCKLPEMEQFWITAEEYDDYGPTIIHRLWL